MNDHNSLIKKIPAVFKLKPYANYISRQLGYELVGDGFRWKDLSGFRLFPRQLPFIAYQRSVDPYYIPFKVDVESMTSRIGFSYQNEGWHPFVETLREYAADPELRYEDSTLARLYENYCPKNVQEVLLNRHSLPMKPFCDWPPANVLIRWVWALNTSSVDAHLARLKSRPLKEGWIFFGPHHEDYGKREFNRLTGVYDSIRKNGYNPELAGHEPVNGYFLKRGNKLRFVLLQGNHRVSALKALGITEVDVLIRRGHPAIIDYNDLNRWTSEGGGIYSSFAANALFCSLFEESGLDKAIRLDLI